MTIIEEQHRRIEDIERAKDQFESAESYYNYLQAEDYLIKLMITAKYRNTLMFEKGYQKELDKILFSISTDLETKGNTEKRIRSSAIHFKDMDDSNKWPTWKKEAIKQAKIYDQYNINTSTY